MLDDELLAGLQSHDARAFRVFCEQHLPSLWRYVCSKLHGDVHIAEDIVSESLIAWLKAVDSGTRIATPSAWLRTVAANKVNDHFRAAARVQKLLDQAGRLQAERTTETPADVTQREETRVQVREAMETLPEKHRLVLEWKYLDRLSVREIAKRLEVTVKSAESTLFRARADLRSRLANEGLVDPSLPDDAPRPKHTNSPIDSQAHSGSEDNTECASSKRPSPTETKS